MYIASETTYEAVLTDKGQLLVGFGLVQMTIKEIRDIYAKYSRDIAICRDESDDAGPGHILVCGKPSPKMRDALRECARWVPGRLPTKPPT